MAKGKVINVSFDNTFECAVTTHLVWLIKNLSIFCDLPFADLIPKTYIAAEVMGLGFLL